MCFYNGIVVSRATHIKLNKFEKEISQYRESLNRPLQSGFEFGNWPVVRLKPGGGDILFEIMHWELIPFYIHTRADLEHFRHGGLNPRTGKRDPPRNTLNAIGEEMFEKVSYKQAASKRRCLVLSSGFYEWRHFTPPGSKKDIAYPYHIILPEVEYFYMAGIWQPWSDEETGETIDSFAIVTTKANRLMEQVHNKKKRMPVILPDQEAWDWIQEGLSQEQVTQLATYQFPADKMEAYTISKDFRTALDPMAPFEYPELPPLEKR